MTENSLPGHWKAALHTCAEQSTIAHSTQEAEPLAGATLSHFLPFSAPTDMLVLRQSVRVIN